MVSPGSIVTAVVPEWSEPANPKARPLVVVNVVGRQVEVAYCTEDTFERRRNHQVRVVGHGLEVPTLVCPYRRKTIGQENIRWVVSRLPEGIFERIIREMRASDYEMAQTGVYSRTNWDNVAANVTVAP